MPYHMLIVYNIHMSELKIVDSKYFISVSHLSFSFLLCLILRNLGLGLTVTLSCDSHSHIIMCYMKEHRRFWKDDIIQHVLYMLALRQIHSYLG